MSLWVRLYKTTKTLNYNISDKLRPKMKIIDFG